jgi:segregation and condensation protein A
MDICDIRIVEITEQYLAIIEQMKQLDLDVAGEFLLMAATLIHIKSRMLLPVSEELVDEEGEDPREELIKRLLEYQRYKDIAEHFQQMPQLDRDVFCGFFNLSDVSTSETEDEVQIAVGVYQLAEAFHHLLKERPAEVFHEVIQETLSVSDYIERIVERLTHKKRQCLSDFFPEGSQRTEMIVTFLAMLELVKMRLINVEQIQDFSEVWLSLAVPAEELTSANAEERALGYG